MLRRALWLLLLVSSSATAAPYEITDSFGKHWFEEVPQRVVVADWTLLDNLLTLGITPVGAPELAAYREQVNGPLPNEVADIGLRVAPNLARIRELKPDVILVGTGQKELARPLSRIATVLYFKQFSDRYRTNGSKSRLRFVQLAAVFQKEALAEELLAKRDVDIKALVDKLRERHGALLPPVTLLQQRSTQQSLRLYGTNSLPGHTLKLLGLTPGLQRPAQQWGEASIKLNELAQAAQGPILFFAPVAQHAQIRASSEWLALPATTRERVILLPPLWPYGSALSIGTMAERIADALL